MHRGVSLAKDSDDLFTCPLHVIHFFEMCRHNSGSPFVRRVKETLSMLSMPESELLAMAVSIRHVFDPPVEDTSTTSNDKIQDLITLVRQQSLQLDEVIPRQTKLEERLDSLEGKSQRCITTQEISAAGKPRQAEHPPKRVGKQAPLSLSAAWYEWLAARPRIYESTTVSRTSSTSIDTRSHT